MNEQKTQDETIDGRIFMPSTQALVSPQEVAPIAYELAKAYQGMVEHFRRHYNLEPAEAVTKAEAMLDPEGGHPRHQERIRNGPPEEVDWWDLTNLARNDPDAMLARWGVIKQAAIDHLESGHRAAAVAEGSVGTPWERAQFLALRQSFMQAWQPTNGIEQALIDTMAQALTITYKWAEQLLIYMDCEVKEQEARDEDQKLYYRPPRVSHQEATDQAGAMMDRFNRIFLRTLRQLRDLRRYAPQVTIQSAGQVNIGGQQINLADSNV